MTPSRPVPDAARAFEEPPEDRTTGDINGDGIVTVSDVVELRGQIMDGTYDSEICDLDGDGTVTVSDVVELRKIIVQGTDA